MTNRNFPFVEGEFYHIYNRGVDKRDTYLDQDDINRFLNSLRVLNTKEPIGSLYEFFRKEDSKKFGGSTSTAFPLVEIIAFCLNPNHFHLLLKPVVENGISKFMQRLGTGYTLFFNEKYDRSGALFQGRFRAVHIDSNQYLLHLSAYINLNFEAHNKWDGQEGAMTASSWPEYVEAKPGWCQPAVILEQFAGPADYRRYALETLEYIKENKADRRNPLHNYLLD